MAKGVVIYPIIATAFVALILLHTSQKPHKADHRHVRLSRRLGGPRIPNFDPLVTKLEQLAELKALLKQKVNENERNDKNSSAEVVEMVEAEIEGEDEAYFGEDGKLNLTLRLTTLFPMIDRSPKDGFVGLRELEDWNIMQAHERMHYKTRKGFDEHDQNHDGLISFSEYLPHFSDEDIKKNSQNNGEAGWWMEQFKNADVDQDGQLNFEELGDFLHPEDSENEKIQEWLLNDRIRRMDGDNDGMLNFEEFKEHTYETFKTYYLFSSSEGSVPSVHLQYSKLDENHDRLLTVEELKPIRHFLFPGELHYAKYISNYLMKEVDDNEDGRLSLDEILRHGTKFYHSIYIADDEEDDDEDEYYLHDEF